MARIVDPRGIVTMQSEKKIRTIPAAYREIKKADPDTCISETAIREAVAMKAIPSVSHGNRRLVTMDAVYAYFSGSKNG